MTIRDSIKEDLKIRWKRMQKAMEDNNADGCLLSSISNLYYTTGRVINGYFYLPVEGEPWLFIKRPIGLEGERVVYIRKPEQLLDVFHANSISVPESLLLEADELTYSEYSRIARTLQPANELNATSFIRRQRMIKTSWELEQFRLSAAKHVETYASIPEVYKSGMTDVEFQIEIERLMRQNGSIGLFRAFGTNMDIFMGNLLAGDNAATPSPYDFAMGGEGISDSLPLGANGTTLKEGMSVMVDMAGNFTPYITDMTRVFSIGQLSDCAYRAYDVALAIQQDMEDRAKPGISCADLYNSALKKVEEEGLTDYFMGIKQQAKFVGHGIGIDINELPVFTSRSKEVLEENMVYAYEPKFVIPGVGAVGVENSYCVKANGIEKLTLFTEDIIQLN